jgi:excinuclease ABC subunit A
LKTTTLPSPAPDSHPVHAATGAAAAAAAPIEIRGATARNLRSIDLDLPRYRLIAITGVSGAGKTSLAVHTLGAAGQPLRNAGRSHRAGSVAAWQDTEVERISRLPVTLVASGQVVSRRSNSARTVGQWLGLWRRASQLWARQSRLICPDCGQVVPETTVAAAHQRIMSLPAQTKVLVLFAPMKPSKRQSVAAAQAEWQREGLIRGIVGSTTVRLDEGTHSRQRPEFLIVDRLVTGSLTSERLTESLEQAQRLGHGRAEVWWASSTAAAPRILDRGTWDRGVVSERQECVSCGASVSATTPDTCLPGGEGSAYRRWQNLALPAWLQMSATSAHTWLATQAQPQVTTLTDAAGLTAELQHRLQLLTRVSLGHLTLDRDVGGLSAGELCRLQLARLAAIAPRESLLIADEPLSGLLPEEAASLIDWLRSWLDHRNTVIVVGHQPELLRHADQIVELGPGGGAAGGQVVRHSNRDGGESIDVAGSAADPQSAARVEPTAAASPAGRSLAEGQAAVTMAPRMFSPGQSGWLRWAGVHLAGTALGEISLPLRGLTVICGPSGAGKSLLLTDMMAASLSGRVSPAADSGSATPGTVSPSEPSPGAKTALVGWASTHFDAGWAVSTVIDAAPLTATSRSTLATWLKIFGAIRELFAATTEAQRRGWTARQFSLHAPDGLRCRACAGTGSLSWQLVTGTSTTRCSECHGRRYREEALLAKLRGISIADVLQQTVVEAAATFRQQVAIAAPLRMLLDLGLGYLALGQSVTTFSSGEAQRLKLALGLSQKTSSRQVLLCDELAAGLHPRDFPALQQSLVQLTQAGHTLIVADNAPQLRDVADWAIRLDCTSDGSQRSVSCGPPA